MSGRQGAWRKVLRDEMGEEWRLSGSGGGLGPLEVRWSLRTLLC